MTDTAILWTAIAGLICSFVAGSAILWLKRNAEVRDHQSNLASKLTGVHVSVEHLSRNIQEQRADTRERWQNISQRLDALPCRDVCANVIALRGGSDERKAMP